MASQFSSGFDASEVLAAAPLYTSREEIEDIWSTLGVDLRLDDDDDGTVSTIEETYLERCMEEATDEINGYLAGTYEVSVMVDVRRIRRFASYLASEILSRRRGNPGVFCDDAESIRETLEALRDGQQILPDVPKRDQMLPMVSNYTIDRRHVGEKLRVDPWEGVDQTVPGKKDDWNALGGY